MTDEDNTKPTPTENPAANDSNQEGVNPNEVSEEKTKPNETKPNGTDDPAKGIGNDENPNDPNGVKPVQSRLDNAKFAAMRREKQEKEKLAAEASQKEALSKAELDGKLSVLKVNPYTKKPIKDEYDLRVYEAQDKLNSEGKDPINDLPDYLAEQDREKETKAKQESEANEAKSKEEAERSKKEVDELFSKHPEVDGNALAKDQDFMKYADDKFGRWTINEIYEGFVKDNPNKKPAKPSEVKAPPKSTPTSTPNGVAPSKSIKDMTDEEFEAYSKKLHGED